MSGLALVLCCQEKYKEAGKMYQETLVLMGKVLGKTHKSTLSIINKLVAVLCCQQKYTEAFEMH